MAAANLDFTDYAAPFSPGLRTKGLLGPSGGRRAQGGTNAYQLAYFERHLKDEGELMLRSPSPEYFEARR